MFHLVGVLNNQEALRNQGILLLRQLVDSHVELQTMAAYEGIFEHLLSILRYAAISLHSLLFYSNSSSFFTALHLPDFVMLILFLVCIVFLYFTNVVVR